MTDEMMLMYIMVYISLRFCILYDTLVRSVDIRRTLNLERAAYVFVVLLRDDTENGVDVLVCCCEARTTL